MKRFLLLLLSCLIYFISCKEPVPTVNIPDPVQIPYGKDSLKLSPEAYYDKVLGALTGSAIGDAMGASTEMWDRRDIEQKYGYITGLTPAVRERSPEGTWEHNLEAGATTDDTRWKVLMVKYFTKNSDNLNPQSFADFITAYYESVARDLADKEILNNPDVLDNKLEKVDWIKEWARVSLAYRNGPEAYEEALSRFYGGEMACAGMLYSPMFGLLASTPEAAYTMGYENSLFDHGYAKDITGLVAAMTQMALQTTTVDSILDTAIFVDPLRYQDSRLVGRISLNLAEASRKKVRQARELYGPVARGMTGPEIVDTPPDFYPGSDLDWDEQVSIYSFLEENKKAIPFHAGEIWQILITGLEYGQGDFQKTMEFIINYGRDNDTVGAVAGMILGAQLGFSGLPPTLRYTALRVNREEMGIDLEVLAREIAALPNTKNH